MNTIFRTCAGDGGALPGTFIILFGKLFFKRFFLFLNSVQSKIRLDQKGWTQKYGEHVKRMCLSD